jgi:hypothetical protein
MREISVSSEASLISQYAVARESYLLDRREHEAVAAGLVTEDELLRWLASQEQAEADGIIRSASLGVKRRRSEPCHGK